MYLLTAQEVSQLLSSQQQAGRVTSGGDVSGYLSPLAKVKTRCEELMEVATISRTVTVDHFDLKGSGTRDRMLRLTNAFLIPYSDILITDFDDEASESSYEIDREKGMVFGRFGPGKIKITYESGFEADEEKYFVGVPDWLQSIAKSAMALHYRLTTQVGLTPDNVSYGDLMQETRRELYVEVSKRFVRNRVGVDFPYRTQTND